MKLIDRFYRQEGQLVIRAQDERTGGCHDVRVSAEDAEVAALYWGGSTIPVVARDGELWFSRPAGLFTEAEEDAIEFASWVAAARRIAPSASDEALREIYEQPMSASQRRKAVQALA